MDNGRELEKPHLEVMRESIPKLTGLGHRSILILPKAYHPVDALLLSWVNNVFFMWWITYLARFAIFKDLDTPFVLVHSSLSVVNPS